MRGPKPEALSLNDMERNALKALVRRHSTPQQLALRGRIILAADAGKNNSQIAREEAVSVDTVRAWRKRWLARHRIAMEDLSMSERLSDVPRPGRPSQITAEQTCQMMALGCSQPKERPISQWTGREIADEVMRRGIVGQISPRHAARLLKKGTGIAAPDPLLVDSTGRRAAGGNGESDLHLISGGSPPSTRGRTDREYR